MILVTGATGTVGGEVLKQALAAGVPVRALARDPARAKALKSIVEVVAGDFADPASLDTAVEGVEGVFMASFDGEKQATLQGNLIEACRRAGVRHVVRLGDDVDERRPAVRDRRAERLAQIPGLGDAPASRPAGSSQRPRDRTSRVSKISREKISAVRIYAKLIRARARAGVPFFAYPRRRRCRGSRRALPEGASLGLVAVLSCG